MTRVTEYVGADGVLSSEYTEGRRSTPKPGDLILWPNGSYGRVWESGTGHCEPDEVHVCRGLGSAFLGRLEGKTSNLGASEARRGEYYVSISGGPFFILKRDELEPTLSMGISPMWNWGDRLPGAGQAVEYQIARPVFRYVGTRDNVYGVGEAS